MTHDMLDSNHQFPSEIHHRYPPDHGFLKEPMTTEIQQKINAGTITSQPVSLVCGHVPDAPVGVLLSCHAGSRRSARGRSTES